MDARLWIAEGKGDPKNRAVLEKVSLLAQLER